MKLSEYDVVINGGGMVGASLACALVSYGFTVALIEASPYSHAERPSFDSRALALTYSSGVIFSNLGIWQGLTGTDVTAIRHIDVIDAMGGGRVRLCAKDVGQEELGWNVEARAMGANLLKLLENSRDVTIFSPMKLINVDLNSGGVLAQVGAGPADRVHRISARLLVIADGSSSMLRDQLKFLPRRVDYRQRALICRVEADRKNRGGAYEYFTPAGPLALLPLGESGYSVVWTQGPEDLAASIQLSRSKFLAKLQSYFGDDAGHFQKLVGERKVYPLTLSHLKKFVRPRAVVVGNASHTFHPVAGQGFNLALRDVASLAQVLYENRCRGWDIGSYDVLQKYARWRTRESAGVSGFTDGLLQIFANVMPGLVSTRGLSLDVLQTLPPLRCWLLERTMGLHGRQPKLSHMALVNDK